MGDDSILQQPEDVVPQARIHDDHSNDIQLTKGKTMTLSACIFRLISLAIVLMTAPAYAAALATLVLFDGASNGRDIYADLIADANGNLYGTTVSGGAYGFGTVFEVSAGTHALTTLASFDGTHASHPQAGLILDSHGNLYGTTYQGGVIGSNCIGSCGTVFEVAAGTHALTTLVTFDGTNGANPYADLVADASGNLYGETQNGGLNGGGTVFEVAAGTHAFSTLAALTSGNAHPEGGLLLAANGNLYGTTFAGGLDASGSVFEISANLHVLTTVYQFNFRNAPYSGWGPEAGLVADANGNLYGTTSQGGVNAPGCISSCGTVFEISAGLHVLTPLATFNDSTTGARPHGRLIIDAAGNLYGTAQFGGPGGQGTVFKVGAGTNTITRLVAFDLGNGEDPRSGLIADSQGNLYGTTDSGGTDSEGNVYYGTVYEVTDSGFVVPTTLAGDFNHDGKVDAADYVIWRKGFGAQSDYNSWRAKFGSGASTGDFNNDGKVDASDYIVWRKSGGTQSDYNSWRAKFGTAGGSGAAIETATVPEPSSLAMFVPLLATLFRRRRLA